MRKTMTYDESGTFVKLLANGTLFFAGIGFGTVAAKLGQWVF